MPGPNPGHTVVTKRAGRGATRRGGQIEQGNFLGAGHQCADSGNLSSQADAEIGRVFSRTARSLRDPQSNYYDLKFTAEFKTAVVSRFIR